MCKSRFRDIVAVWARGRDNRRDVEGGAAPDLAGLDLRRLGGKNTGAAGTTCHRVAEPRSPKPAGLRTSTFGSGATSCGGDADVPTGCRLRTRAHVARGPRSLPGRRGRARFVRTARAMHAGRARARACVDLYWYHRAPP